MAHLGELKRVKCYGTKCLYVMTAVHAQNLFSLFSLSERGTKVRYEKKGKIERERESIVHSVLERMPKAKLNKDCQ